MGNIIKNTKVNADKAKGDRKQGGACAGKVVLRDVPDSELNRRRVPVYKYLL